MHGAEQRPIARKRRRAEAAGAWLAAVCTSQPGAAGVWFSATKTACHWAVSLHRFSIWAVWVALSSPASFNRRSAAIATSKSSSSKRSKSSWQSFEVLFCSRGVPCWLLERERAGGSLFVTRRSHEGSEGRIAS